MEGVIGREFEVLSKKALKHYEVLKEKGSNVHINRLSYDEFMLLGNEGIERRFADTDEVTGGESKVTCDDGGVKNGGEREVKWNYAAMKRKKFDGEDTITNRLINWEYSEEQKAVLYKAIEAGVKKEEIMEWFYPEMGVEEMMEK